MPRNGLPEKLRSVRCLVVLGDSITELGGEPGGYVTLLERRLVSLSPSHPIRIVNAGVSGHRSSDMLGRFDRELVTHRPDLVLVNAGVNDVWHAFHDWETGRDHPDGSLPAGVSLPAFRANVASMVLVACARGVRVILLSPTLVHEDLARPENARLTAYVEAEREEAAALGCGFIDLNTPFRQAVAAWREHAVNAEYLLTTDGVHLNAAGNHLMAAVILRGLGVEP